MMKAEMEGLRGELKNLKKVVKDLEVKTTINQFLPNSQTYSTIVAFGVNCLSIAQQTDNCQLMIHELMYL